MTLLNERKPSNTRSRFKTSTLSPVSDHQTCFLIIGPTTESTVKRVWGGMVQIRCHQLQMADRVCAGSFPSFYPSTYVSSVTYSSSEEDHG